MNSKAFGFGVSVFVLFGFIATVSISFNRLLDPVDELQSVTMSNISNSYEESGGSKGTLYDCNGVPIMATVAVDDSGQPLRDNGLLVYAKDLPSQKNQATRRLVVADNSKAWSNVVSSMSGGYDRDFRILLTDIPVEQGESSDLYLTLDNQLQDKVYSILDDCGISDYISAVVYDCTDGSVLSEVSLPSYDSNAFLNGEIPYTLNNTDNSLDCVQDYFKKWNEAKLIDVANEGSTHNARDLIRSWRQDLSLLTENEFNELTLGENTDSTLCQLATLYESYIETVQEPSADNKNYEFLKDNNEKTGLDFNKIYEDVKKGTQFCWEPIALGDGKTYIPFVKVIIDDTTYYARLYYGNNNFIWRDCQTNGFDPNFSFSDYTTLNTVPGSAIKALMAAMLVDQGSETLLDVDNGNMELKKEANAGNNSTYSKLRASDSQKRAGQINTLQDGLIFSDNDYFTFTAVNIGEIVETNQSSYDLTYKDSYTFEELNKSGTIMEKFFQNKFCFNSEESLTSYFDLAKPRILGSIGNVQLLQEKSHLDENYVSNNPYYYKINKETREVDYTTPYVRSEQVYVKALGDTGYGQGNTGVSPMYMAMAMGKMLTGEMHSPKVVKTELDDGINEIIGEPFDRATTVPTLRKCLEAVSSSAGGDFQSGLTYFSKTGTCVVGRSSGTQSTYGLFAGEEFANYPKAYGRDDYYQLIWYCGGVEDTHGHTYSIVIRAFFDKESSSSHELRKPYFRICETLSELGYLVN